ncbi:MAG: biopolymer transporter ExbD [Pseudomonadota bacterium]
MITRSGLAALAALAAVSAALSACASEEPDNQPPQPLWTINETQNLLKIASDDTILWNGEQATPEQLRELLAETVTMDPEPRLRFEPDIEASYELSAQVLRVIKESGVTKFGFVGNEKYRVPEPAEN